MFDLSREYIKENCSGFSFDRGLEYHFGNRVRQIQYNPQKRLFTATVHDLKERAVSCAFDADGRLVSAQCGCRLPSDRSSHAFCEHIVAVLLLIEQRDGEGFFGQLKDREKAKRVFELFSYQDTAAETNAGGWDAAAGGQRKTVVTLETVFVLPERRAIKVAVAQDDFRAARFFFRIRQGASAYLVKSVERFVWALARNRPMEFGRKSAFDPARQRFDGLDAEICEFLLELSETVFGPPPAAVNTQAAANAPAAAKATNIYEIVQSMAGNPFASLDTVIRHSPASARIFDDKFLCLTDRQFRRFLELYVKNGRPLMIETAYGARPVEVPILDEGVPLGFRLERDGRDIVLKVDLPDDLLPLTRDGGVVYCQGAVRRLPNGQSPVLRPLLTLIGTYGENEFRFISEDRGRFVSEVLPTIERLGDLAVDDEVSALLEHSPLSAGIYLDRDGDAVTADVHFQYGAHDINPFAAVPKNTRTAAADAEGDAPIIVRDVVRENEILDALADADFKVRNGKISLHDDDSIFNFVVELLPRLQKFADVYYSQDFRQMTVRRGVGFRARLSFDGGGGLAELLSFDFDTDLVDRDELVEIMRGIREKRRYYKLRDGTLLNLGERETLDIMRLMEQIGASDEDIRGGHITMPGYRALYLDYYLRNSEIVGVGRDKIFREFVRSLSDPGDTEYAPPRGVENVLRDYQRTGFKWLRALSEYSLGGILADDMGLGKTLQVLVLLLSVKEDASGEVLDEKPGVSLIVAPTSLIYNWCAEIEKFTPKLRYIAISGGKAERAAQIATVSQYDVAITSYPLIRRDYEEYRDIPLRYCILDEAQYIKNPNSQNAISVKCLRAQSRFALTGTPMENNLMELWSIFDFVLPGYLRSASQFHAKYAHVRGADTTASVSAPAAEDTVDDTVSARDAAAREAPAGIAPPANIVDDSLFELSGQIKPFILRRLKKDVLRELPDKIDTRMYAQMTDGQKKLYLAYLEKVREELASEISANGFEKSQIVILAALTRLRQICCHPALFVEGYEDDSGKLLLLQELVREALGGGHRILLFSQFTSMLALIRRWADAERIAYHYLDGQVKPFDRHRMIGEFNGGAGDMFLLSLKAGGTGVNLTGADTVIHYDPWWNPAVEDQATDRAYRIGQQKTVQVIKLLTAGTIEEKIFAIQERKKRLIDAVIRPGETFLTKLSKADLDWILEISD